MKTIILLCEVNDSDYVLLSHVEPLAKAFSSRVYLIHVAAPDPDFVGYQIGPQHERDRRANVLRHEHQSLQKYADLLREKGLDANALLVQGETVLSVLDEAERLKADLIVLGNHHRNLFHKVASNRVSDILLRKSTYPLLLVPIES